MYIIQLLSITASTTMLCNQQDQYTVMHNHAVASSTTLATIHYVQSAKANAVKQLYTTSATTIYIVADFICNYQINH